MFTTRFLFGVIAASIALSGCVVTTDTTDGSPYAYPTEDDFCEALATAECSDEVVSTCYGSDDSSLDSDRASCVDERLSECNPNNYDYNPENAETCIIAWQSIYEDAELTRDEIDNAEEICLLTLSDGRSQGSTCTADGDCDAEDGLRCVIKTGETSGKCETPNEVSGGSKCDNDDDVCEDGFYCLNSEELGGYYCIEKQGLGDACSSAKPCNDDYYCDVEAGDDSGECVAKKSNNEDCTTDEECSGTFCIRDDASSETGTCKSVYRFESSSTTCDDF